MTRAPWWLWMNLLSLDAPVVALVWQDFLRCAFPATMLRPSGRAVLGLTVWAIYLTDRLLDAWRSPSQSSSVYQLHRRLALVLLGCVLIVDLLIAFLWLRPTVLSKGFLLLAAVMLYFVVFAVWGVGGKWVKKLSAAILFTAGVFLVSWTSERLIAPAVTFALLCFANLVVIESRKSWVWILPLACGLLGSSWYLAVALSALGLGMLDLSRKYISNEARRVLADAVLLTPLLFR